MFRRVFKQENWYELICNGSGVLIRKGSVWEAPVDSLYIDKEEMLDVLRAILDLYNSISEEKFEVRRINI